MAEPPFAIGGRRSKTLLQRIFRRTTRTPVHVRIEPVVDDLRLDAHNDNAVELLELHIVGESHRQDTLAAISGPRRSEGKKMTVGVTLRCEPTNAYDAHAIRVEVMGQHVAYVARDQAALIADAMKARCRGVIEAPGLIVGGWKNAESEGHYGIRVWITTKDTDRLGVQPRVLDPSFRPQLTYPTIPACRPTEMRLGPTRQDLADHQWGSDVTVTGEEYYQPVIVRAMPNGWDDRSWPLLVGLSMVDRNPHTTKDRACVQVAIGDDPVGYFTPAMSARFGPMVQDAVASGLRATVVAHALQGTKGGQTFWRLKVAMPKAHDSPTRPGAPPALAG